MNRTEGYDSLTNSGRSISGIKPVRVMSELGGVALTDPGVSVAISTVDPVETRELSDPLLIATYEPLATLRPVPPAMLLRWIAVFGDPETEIAVCDPSHVTSIASSTTGQAQFVITIAFCA